MFPLRLFIKVAGTAFITAGALALLGKKMAPSASDVMACAVHFKKGCQEFQQGMSTIFFGSSQPTEEALKERKEASRIVVE